MSEDDTETDVDVEIYRQMVQAQEQRAEEVMLQVERKGLNGLLDCTLDVMVTEEYGSGACLYHNFVCIIAYDINGERIGFGVLHPADDRDKCPSNEPPGFSLPWNFDPKEACKLVRRLAFRANEIYKSIGIAVAAPLEAVTVPETFIPEENDPL